MKDHLSVTIVTNVFLKLVISKSIKARIKTKGNSSVRHVLCVFLNLVFFWSIKQHTQRKKLSMTVTLVFFNHLIYKVN